MQPKQVRESASGHKLQVRSSQAKRTPKAADRLSPPFVTLTDEAEFLKVKKQLQVIIQKSDEQHRSVIGRLVEQMTSIEEERAVFLLIEVTQYFENIGDAEQALRILEICVEKSLRLGDLNLQRKAFNNIATAHARLCDYESACLYYEKALRLAASLGDPFFRFAALCNIVALLQVMGLVNTAKQISLRLLAFPEGTPNLDYLHLQNAINGSQLSRATSDHSSAKIFDRIARRKIHSASSVGETWKAYVKANHAWCLCHDGLIGEATDLIEAAIANVPRRNNLRVNAILMCARAQNALQAADSQQIEAAKADLRCLLLEEKLLPLHKEEILRSLIDLHTLDESGEERRTGMKYLRQLNDHLITVKHRRFFSKLSIAELSETSNIMPPSYNIPPSIAQAAAALSSASALQRAAIIDADPYADAGVFRSLCVDEQLLESSKRSRSYCVAEDWAVAADFASEHGYRHCFLVGKLAGLIGLSLGFDKNTAVALEMACRLHDIGKLAINETTHRAVNVGMMEEYFVVREHAIVGARLLAASDDPLLQMAGHIAHHHHEWWNGSGFPDGKIATDIPIEARICAVANCYVSLMLPAGGRQPWERSAAVNQIVSMAGVQLDPSLVAPFLKAVESFNLEIKECCESQVPVSRLYAAKHGLLSAVTTENSYPG